MWANFKSMTFVQMCGFNINEPTMIFTEVILNPIESQWNFSTYFHVVKDFEQQRPKNQNCQIFYLPWRADFFRTSKLRTIQPGWLGLPNLSKRWGCREILLGK